MLLIQECRLIIQSNTLICFKSMGSFLEKFPLDHELIFLAVSKSCNETKFKNTVSEYSDVPIGCAYVPKAVAVTLVRGEVGPMGVKTVPMAS